MSWNERLPYWILILLFIVYIRQCTGPKPCAPCEDAVIRNSVKTDTMYKLDTLYVPSYIPQLVSAEQPSLYDATAYTEIDTAAIVADYEKQRIYKDSQDITNGYILINDTVTKNRLSGRSFYVNVKTPVVTNTKTETVFEKPRNQLYLGIGAYGNKTVPINAAGLSLMFKTKRDKIYEGGAFVDWKGTVWYYGGMKFKIKIR